jgi:hypothetical protein
VLLGISAVGCGVIAGVYLAFSAFVMAALRAVSAAAGIAAMRAVNRVILRAPFMRLFLGTRATTCAAAGTPGAVAASMAAPGIGFQPNRISAPFDETCARAACGLR